MLIKSTPNPARGPFRALVSEYSPKVLRGFARMVRNHRWEQCGDTGLVRIGTVSAWRGYGQIKTDGGLIAGVHNTATTEGMTHILDVAVAGGSQTSTWYFVPFSSNATPAITWTAANFNSNATEITNYTEATRQAWVEGTPSASSVGTSTDAEFTADTGGFTTYGAGLTSISTKSSASGVLLSAFNYGSAVTFAATKVAKYSYTLTLANA